MNRITKSGGLLLLSLTWIFVTCYHFYPINSVGALLSFRSGLLFGETEIPHLQVAHESREANIYIDSLGIPYVFASSEQNAMLGLGYMHARDRYFQMEFLSRMVEGSLCAILGKNFLRSDANWIAYDFSERAEELLNEFQTQHPDVYAGLVAYSEGVNLYLENNVIDDPMYKLLDLQARKWKPAYCLYVNWYISRSLSFFDYDLEMQELITELSPDHRAAFFPFNPKDLQTILPGKEPGGISENYQSLSLPHPLKSIPPANFTPGLGSNNWAINKGRTSNNIGLLANDPHLPLTLPSIFYEAFLSCDDFNIAGYSIAGLPLIVGGHNNHMAWGITNGEWDVTDRYLLTTKNDSHYLYDGNWIPFSAKEYEVPIRGAKSEKVSHLFTVHGRVLKDSNGNFYAQRWYGAEAAQAVAALFEMQKAKNWTAFRTALTRYDYPAQNFIYADIKDTIGIFCAGELPARPQGYTGGLLDGSQKLLEGVQQQLAWYQVQTQDSFLFSANQQPLRTESYLGAHWYKDDYRVNRIHELLQTKETWDLASAREMQQDVVDVSFFAVQELLQQYQQATEKYPKIEQSLSNWDGKMTEDSKAALTYEYLRKSVEQVAAEFAKEELGIQRSPSFKYFVRHLNPRLSPEQQTEKEVLFERILFKTDSSLVASFGENWENQSLAASTGFMINHVGFLPGFVTRIDTYPGNRNTINMNSVARPVFRTIFELSDQGIQMHNILAGGQSGILNAKNYCDQLDRWRAGEYKATLFPQNEGDLLHIVQQISID